MKTITQSNLWRAIFHGGFFVLAVLFLLYICGIGIKSVFRYNAFHREHVALQQELKAVSRQNNYYKAVLSRRNNPEFWEYQAKKRLGYVLPGENVYRVIE